MSVYNLSYENKKLYNEISRGISAHQQKVSITVSNSDSVLAIYNKVLSENPDGILYKVGSIKMVSSLINTFLLIDRINDKKVVTNLPKILEERDRIVRMAQKKNNYYDAIMTVYRFFINNYRYSDYDDEAFHQINSPLQNHNAVCEGFSLLFSEILNMAHIPCGVVSGTSNRNGKQEPHSWNIVKYKNFYYHLDVTWDICTKDDQSDTLDYFMLDDTLISRDHSWNDSSIPKCLDNKEEYYERNKMVCRSQNEVINYLTKRIKSGDCSIGYRLVESNETILTDNIVSNTISKAFKASGRSYSQISYRVNETSGTVVLYVKY